MDSFYSEITCVLCGVSFRTVRLRCADEPLSANLGGPVPFMRYCSNDSGCSTVMRSKQDVDKETPAWMEELLKYMVLDDATGRKLVKAEYKDAKEWYVEWLADLRKLYRDILAGDLTEEHRQQEDEEGEEEGVTEVSEDSALDEDGELEENSEMQPGKTVRNDQREKEKGCDQDPSLAEGSNEDEQSEHEYEEQDEEEHIAGPGCTHPGGYNGNEITLEEMRYCSTWQALVRKVDTTEYSYRPEGGPFGPESDDEDFEREGSVFLSGLSDRMYPRNEGGGFGVTPIRHGVEQEPMPENHLWDWADDVREYSLPFHPYCLEIYKRASLARTGSIDIEGLVDWWTIEHTYEDYKAFPRTRDVTTASEMEHWIHENGSEYLVAYPLAMPKLTEIFLAAQEPQQSFNTSNGAFSPSSFSSSSSSDPFISLSAELKFQILHYLPSLSIASLRLASRAFHQLPISLFHTLLQREKPYLWECQPTLHALPYSRWSVVTEKDLKSISESTQDIIAFVIDVFVHNETDPKLVKYYTAKARRLKAETVSRQWMGRDVKEREWEEMKKGVPVDLERMNWFRLYTLLARHEKSMKGLRNRKRIWEDCEEILRRVQRYRKSGTIPIVEDVNDLVQARAEEDERRARELQQAEAGR